MTLLDIRRLNVWAFVFLIVINLMLALIIILSHNTNIRGAEEHFIYTIQSIISNNNNLYPNPEQIPYAVSGYMPCYYIFCDKIISFLGLAPGKDVHMIYVICRGLSFSFTIFLAICLGKIMYNIFDFSLYESWIVASFSVFITVPWFYVVRPDVFVSFFSFAALYVFLKYMNEQRLKFAYLLIAGVLCFFSFYSKQNGLITFLILASYLFFVFRFKDLSILIGGFFLGFLIGYIFYMPYSSSFFMENTYKYLADSGINIVYALKKPYKFSLTRFGMIVFLDFTAIYFLLMTEGIKKIDKKIQLIIYYFVVLLIFSSLTSLKPGSAINYFNDTFILSLIILAIALRKFLNYYELDREINYFKYLLCIVIISFGFTVSVQNYYAYGISNLKAILRHDDPYNCKIVGFLNSEINKGNDFYFFTTSSFLNNRFPGNCILPQASTYSAIFIDFRNKTSGYSDLEEEVDNGKIKFIINEGKIVNFLNVELRSKFTFYKRVGKHDIYINLNSV